MPDSDGSFMDSHQSAHLCDVGLAEYIAATAIAADGAEHLVLAHQPSIGDTDVVFDPMCTDVTHEQLGALPLEFVRRLAIAARTHRCGRPTQAGTPCRNTVTQPGQHCTWHRTTSERSSNA